MKLNLTGEWKLRSEFLSVTAAQSHEVAKRKDGAFAMLEMDKPRRMPSRDGFITATVPCDVITPLVENGILGEPSLKTNSTDCMWVGDYSWWFIRNFTVSEELYNNEEVRLFIEMLDYNADIIVNGSLIENHRNTFRAFNKDIKKALQIGENQIIIRLTVGYEEKYPNDALTFYCNSKFGQRVYLRKPQFTHGWDWCKPVPTCGIGGRVELNGVSGARIDFFRFDTLSIAEDSAEVKLHYEIENLSMCTADDAVLEIEIKKDGKSVYSSENELYVAGGITCFDTDITIKKPELWWPNGSGKQPLYTVSSSVTCRSIKNSMPDKRVGIRTITIDQSKLSDGTRNFRFVVNGKGIFCKGGNWVPADSVYLRVSKDKYETLVKEAAACNSNMLRVWGGGLYEPDCFYDCCSEQGILVMQDFMYACAYYPDYLPWFMHEAALEADYQTKRLASQPCMAVWTGNNEIHESHTDWFKGEFASDKLYGAKIFNYLLPDMVRKNSPLISYMPSSPFYGNKANDLLSGDCHVWSWTRKPNETGFEFMYELEAFDRIAEKVRFSSEYGFYGALKRSSVDRFFDGEEVKFENDIWTYHGEQKNKKRLINEAIDRHLIDTDSLDENEYLLYCGIMQGVLYDEMTTALRMRPQCSGQLIWMYNDCWPETGWTIIDYYTTRKNSFYFLKRAFAPKKVIVRALNGRVSAVCINESAVDICASFELGYMTFDGKKSGVTNKEITVSAFSRVSMDLGEATENTDNGFYYVRELTDIGFDNAISLRGYYRKNEFPDGEITIVRTETIGNQQKIVIKSEDFVPVVNVALSDDRIKLSDNYFTLLPNEEKTVIVDSKEIPTFEAVKFKKS